MQSILVGGRMALVEMSSHKLRSSLSILGVTLGVASLVVMLTLIGGIDTFLNDKMGRWAGTVWFFGKREPAPEEKMSWSRSPGLRYSDGIYLEKNEASVKQFVRSISRHDRIRLSGRGWHAIIRGLDSVTLSDEMEHIYIKNGRTFVTQDYKSGEKVCLISWEIEENLVRDWHIDDTLALIGRKLELSGTPFTIIGSFHPRDTTFKPWFLRRAAMVPIKSMQKYITGFDPDPERLELRVSDPENVVAEAEKISRTLIARHRGVEDFEYRAADWLEEVTKVLGNVGLLMGIVSAMSLLVGGLGIMNVMLSSISERVKEIGVRKALGAKNLQIFIQFITETITLSLAGGCIGMALGMTPLMFKEAIKKSTDGTIEPTILFSHLILTCIVIVSVGILFGLYPAVKATRLNPIDALQYE